MAVVEIGQSVTLQCVPFLENGKFLDREKGNTLVLTAGAKEQNQLSNTLSSVIVGMKIFEIKKYRVPAKYAFGEIDSNKIYSLSLDKDHTHKIGDEIDLKVRINNINSIKKGRIPKIEQNNAKVDTNHPLAGENLIFAIKILAINANKI